MTKRQKAGEPRTTLTVDKILFTSELEELLTQAQKIKDKKIRTDFELDLMKEEFEKWKSNVSEFLKSSFNNPTNEYRTEFLEAGSSTGVLDVLYQNPDRHSIQSKIKYHKLEVDLKINCLESFKDRTKYMLTDGTVQLNQDKPIEYLPTNTDTKISEKLYQFLVHLFDTRTTYDIHEFLLHSEIHVQIDFNSKLLTPGDMHIIVDPEIYKKYNGSLNSFKSEIGSKYREFAHMTITGVQVYPNLNKFQILNNRITPVVTPWEEINSLQAHLIDQLRTAEKTIDFQNIGNTSRTLLQKVANHVFDPLKHIAPDAIDLGEAKFKNRLHTYIKTELANSKQELRDYAISVITTAEKSVDLANTLTHDLKANLMMAESCVISVVTVISLVKMIEK